MTPRNFSTDQFTWTPSEQAFSAEKSELRIPPGESPLGPLPNNRSGILLTSSKTGTVAEFHVCHVEWSKENEILWWVLRLDGTVQTNNRLVRVVIYND